MNRYLSFVLIAALKAPIVSADIYESADILNGVIFQPIRPMDENLSGIGVDFRRMYFDEFGSWPQEGPCTIFEMVAGLALKCDEMLSVNPSESVPYLYFMELIQNIRDHGINEGISTNYSVYLFNEVGDDLWAMANRYFGE